MEACSLKIWVNIEKSCGGLILLFAIQIFDSLSYLIILSISKIIYSLTSHCIRKATMSYLKFSELNHIILFEAYKIQKSLGNYNYYIWIIITHKAA